MTLSARPMSFATDNTERMRLDADGNMGIGTTSPTARLDVNGDVNANTYYGDGSNLTGISAAPSFADIRDYGTSTSSYTSRDASTIYICYGQATTETGNAVTIGSLPFSSASSYKVMVGKGISSGYDDAAVVVTRNSGLSMTLTCATTGVDVNWMAIGY